MGLPGSGKTSVGRALHEQLGWSWVDVDSEVERSAGRSIAELIRVEGEQAFRAQESEELRKALKSGVQAVSVGGGALLRTENQTLIAQHGYAVHLAVSVEVAAQRALSDELGRSETSKEAAAMRPVLFPAQAGKGGAEHPTMEDALVNMSKLAAARAAQYESAKLSVWTDFADPASIAKIIAREVKLAGTTGAEKVSIIPDAVSNHGKLSEVVIASGAVGSFGERLAMMVHSPRKVAIVVDENLSQYVEKLEESLVNAKFETARIVLPSGETSKSFTELNRILDRLAELGLTRDDLLIGLGGGVVGDISGLAAALYMRGIQHVQVPSTIVAQVDSALGGKNAINLERGKNLVGTFHLPRAVVSDSETLATLPEREYISGLAEVIKYGLIFSTEFFEWLEGNVEAILQRKHTVLSRIIEYSSVAKTGVVAKDIYDTLGLRALLNFGHTVGHAVENLSGYGEFLHGEAIAIGMKKAVFVGTLLEITPPETISRVALLLRKLGLPTEMPERLLRGGEDLLRARGVADVRDIVRQGRVTEGHLSGDAADFEKRWAGALKADKKRSNDFVNFIVLEKIGAAKVVKVELDTLIGAVAWNR
ncbi:MAG: 3-dehydroquinate synthase [Bdellovibrionota bacterium]